MSQRRGNAASQPPPPAEPIGVECPDCGCRHLPVYYTRARRGFILRIRHCRNCGRRVITRERT